MDDFLRLSDEALERAAGGNEQKQYSIEVDDLFYDGFENYYMANEPYSGTDGGHSISTKQYVKSLSNGGWSLWNPNCPMKVWVLDKYEKNPQTYH